MYLFQADERRSTTRSSYVDPPLPNDVEAIELDFVAPKNSRQKPSDSLYTRF